MQGLADIKYRGRAARWAAFGAAIAFCFATAMTTASASSRKRGVKQAVALAPTTADGNVAKAQLESVDRALASSAGQHADVVGTRTLDKRVGRGSFAGAIRSCKGDTACFVKLARAIKVEVLVVPVAKADSDGITVTATVAGANDTIHRVSFTFATAADLNTAITKNAKELFTRGQGSEEPALESLAALPLEPLATTPTVTPAAPPTTPPATSEPPAIAKVETPPAPETLELTPPPELPAPLSTTQTVPPPRREHSIGWGTYVGASVAAVGIAGVTYGIVEYLQHKSIVNDANADPTLTQREAQAKDQAAKSKYDHSRIGLYAGVPLLVVGAALITWDIVIADHGKSADNSASGNHLKLSIAPSPSGGAYGSAIFTW